MSDYIFVDASAWIAIINQNDPKHQEAWSMWRSIIENDWPLLTTNWTLYEALTILRSRGGFRLSEELWDLSQPEQGLVKVATVSQPIEQAAVRTFLLHKDKLWSVVDCANFHALRGEGCQQAFAYDDCFRQASGEFGFQLLG